MTTKEWRDADHKTAYYYRSDNGKIVGQIYNLAHTNIYGAKIFENFVDEKYLGQYISLESAKKAVEYYWNIQERTLTHETTS